MFATASTVSAFLLYCFVQGITPGPANTVSFAAGIAHGRRCALRQWVGLVAGFLVVSAASFGLLWMLGSLVDGLVAVLSVIGAAYILFLALRMLGHAGDASIEGEASAPSVRTGFLVQVTNAKIVLACIAAFSSYVLPYALDPGVVAFAVMAMPLIGTACNLVWLMGGSLLQGVYQRHGRIVNIVMALSLAACAASMVHL